MTDNQYSSKSGHPDLHELDDGTRVRHKYRRGDHAGETVDAQVHSGHIVYNDQAYSPTGAAREANRDITGKEYEVNGWRWWDYYDKESEEWKQLSYIREGNDENV